MLDTFIKEMERLFHKKLMLYNDLLHCLEKERKSLIDVDLDTLWSISREKEEICSKIKSIQQEITSTINPGIDQKTFNLNRILDMIPGDKRGLFQKEYLALMKLKNEIEVFRKENMLYIDDSLHFLDEMISIITGESKSKIMYNDKCHMTESGANILLRREA